MGEAVCAFRPLGPFHPLAGPWGVLSTAQLGSRVSIPPWAAREARWFWGAEQGQGHCLGC